MQQDLRQGNGQHEQIFANKGSFDIVFDNGLNRFLFGCATKVEKLSIATELLTNLFETHPLAPRLLTSIFTVHETCFSLLKQQAQKPAVIGLETLLVLILEYRSLIIVGRHGGLISSMNGDLLQREVTMLVYELEKEITTRKTSTTGYGGTGASVPISRDFLASTIFDETRIAKQVEVKKHLPESRPLAPLFSQGHSDVRYVSDKKPIKDNQIKSETVVSQSGTFEKNVIAPEKKERRSEILKILKWNGASDIRYIQGMVPGVSEKTIQRELNAMIIEGLVIRKGIKRWSTYELGSSNV